MSGIPALFPAFFALLLAVLTILGRSCVANVLKVAEPGLARIGVLLGGVRFLPVFTTFLAVRQAFLAAFLSDLPLGFAILTRALNRGWTTIIARLTLQAGEAAAFRRALILGQRRQRRSCRRHKGRNGRGHHK